MALLKTAVKELRRAAAYIEQEPEGFDQETYGYMGPHTDARCGTACCIAGTVLLLNNPRLYLRLAQEEENNIKIGDAAQALLHLSQKQAANLFCMADDWPAPFDRKYAKASSADINTAKKRARVVVARIEYFIRTGGK